MSLNTPKLDDQSYRRHTSGAVIGTIVGLIILGASGYFIFSSSNEVIMPNINNQSEIVFRDEFAGSENTLSPNQPVSPGAQELKAEILQPGSGEVAKVGDQVTVHYTGWLTNGSKFDSSVDRDEPFVFSLGAGQVIQGWDQGVVGMLVGEKRKLIIPPQLGYGESGTPGGPIPPNATLIFEVELLAIN
ncbi:MAG: FKBP-type peptidyl-prolyl cis-trans isomerase [Patescibacteria group bacterium]